MEYIIENLLQLLFYLLTCMSYLSKEIAILLSFKSSTYPWLTIEQIFVNIGLHDGVLNLWQLTVSMTTDDIPSHTVANAEFLPHLMGSWC